MAKLTGPVAVTPASDSHSRHATALASLGSRAYSEFGEYVYVTAGEAISASGDPVSLDGGLGAVKRGDADTEGAFFGVAESPFASGESGYVCVKGFDPDGVDSVVASGAVAGDFLEMSGTEGQFKKITSSGVAVAVALEASDDASTARIDIMLL